MRHPDGFIDVVALLRTLFIGTVGLLVTLSQTYTHTAAITTPQSVVSNFPTPSVSISLTQSNDLLLNQPTQTESEPFNTSVNLFSPTSTPSPSPIRMPTATTATIFPTPMLTTDNRQLTTFSPTPTQSPSPTLIPTMIPTSIPIPTSTSFPTSTPTAIPTPTIIIIPTKINYQKTATPEGSLNADVIFELINEHRQKKSLPIFEKNDFLCKVAQDRRPQLTNEIFGTKYIHEGFYEMNLPYWITENMAFQNSEESILSWWLKSSLHRRAIEGNFTYSCGACAGDICIQLFTNFIPR